MRQLIKNITLYFFFINLFIINLFSNTYEDMERDFIHRTELIFHIFLLHTEKYGIIFL